MPQPLIIDITTCNSTEIELTIDNEVVLQQTLPPCADEPIQIPIDEFVGDDCPTLCQQLDGADWETDIKPCLSPEQIEDIEDDLCDCPPPTPCPIGAKPLKTFQTTVHRTGDDGDTQRGRLVNRTTLAANNPYGNTNRYTDLAGGQTYPNGIILDWSTYDGAEVLGIHFDATTNTTWNNQIDNSIALTLAGYSGWRLINIKEICHLGDLENGTQAGFSLNYSPLNITDGVAIWSSTTNAGNTANAMQRAANGNLIAAGKTGSARRIDVRYFTNAELGI